MDLGRSILAGSLTMALLILPIIIVASREGLRAVPQSIRDGSLALGATRWQTVRFQVLPSRLPSMMTGVILALSRAIGETAPLIMLGALLFIPYTPSGPMDRFTALPIQIFNWVSRPQADFQTNAAAGIIVLLIVLLSDERRSHHSPQLVRKEAIVVTSETPVPLQYAAVPAAARMTTWRWTPRKTSRWRSAACTLGTASSAR